MKKNVVWWVGVKNDLYSEKYGGWEWIDISKKTWQYWCALRDMDNLKWIHDSIKGYESFFNYKLDIKKYVNSSPMIFNESHKEIFKSFKQLYYDNVDTFVELQDKIVRKGTEQTPLNYWLQINNVDINLSLPLPFKLTHMNRKELFSHNWQINQDKTPFFIKYGYDWVFTGFAKDQRSNLMRQTWDMVKHHYDDNFILNRLKTKQENKNTTSGKFKEDIYKIFSDPKFKKMTMLELGCHMGNTTRLYAECFGKVIAVEQSEHNLSVAKETCSDVNNVEFILSDVYDSNFSLPKADIVHIDAGHTYEHVIYDIDRCIEQMNNPIIIMDDHGHEGRTVRNAIIDKMKEGKLQLHTYIGEDKGYVASNDKVFIGREGLICNV